MTDDALTGLDIITVAAVVLIIAGFAVSHFTFGIGSFSRTGPQGLIPLALKQSGDQLNVLGPVTGFPAVSWSSGGITVIREDQDPGRLGAVAMTLSLFIGSTGGIDMERTGVFWTGRSGTETIRMTTGTRVVCPNWTVVNKLNINPFRSADEDNILEPGETFDVFVCPSRAPAPSDPFTVVFQPPGTAIRFPVSRTVPPVITTTMQLG
jgi:hypothetical protein